MTPRKHFSVWEWLDFIRGAADSTRATPMQHHLSSHCVRCEAVVRVLRCFAEQAAAEAAKEAPPEVVRRVEAIFPQRRAKSLNLARLVFDSFREPLLAGMRAEELPSRHVRYQADNVVVDLQMEQDAGVVSLLGQISYRERSLPATTGLPVLLMTARGLVASAVCNGLGEFELEYKAVRDLRMYVPVSESGAHLELRMDELAPPLSRRGWPVRRLTGGSADAPKATGKRRARTSRKNSKKSSNKLLLSS
jgi:hypothetical protein